MTRLFQYIKNKKYTLSECVLISIRGAFFDEFKAPHGPLMSIYVKDRDDRSLQLKYPQLHLPCIFMNPIRIGILYLFLKLYKIYFEDSSSLIGTSVIILISSMLLSTNKIDNAKQICMSHLGTF